MLTTPRAKSGGARPSQRRPGLLLESHTHIATGLPGAPPGSPHPGSSPSTAPRPGPSSPLGGTWDHGAAPAASAGNQGSRPRPVPPHIPRIPRAGGGRCSPSLPRARAVQAPKFHADFRGRGVAPALLQGRPCPRRPWTAQWPPQGLAPSEPATTRELSCRSTVVDVQVSGTRLPGPRPRRSARSLDTARRPGHRPCVQRDRVGVRSDPRVVPSGPFAHAHAGSPSAP